MARDAASPSTSTRPVARLTVGERQRVEILKALYRDARILVLDEPTAVLTPHEADGLFASCGGSPAAGLAVIFISHKLGEVLAVAHRIAVLRGGRKVGEIAGRRRRPARHRRPDGRPRDAGEPARAAARPARRSSSSTGSALAAQPAQRRCTTCRSTARAGEIVGIAGVSGNGQAALAALIAGPARPETGTAPSSAAPLRGSARGRRRRPASRASPRTATTTASSAPCRSPRTSPSRTLGEPAVQRGGFLRFAAIRQRARDAIAAFDIRCPGPDAPMRGFSPAATSRS